MKGEREERGERGGGEVIIANSRTVSVSVPAKCSEIFSYLLVTVLSHFPSHRA